jgi:hypothetical protein
VTQKKANEKWEKVVGNTSEVREHVDDENQEVLQGKEGNKIFDASEAPHKPSVPAQSKVACEICGLFNHATKDYRRMICEIRRYNYHTAYDCRRRVLWNTGPNCVLLKLKTKVSFS